MPRFEFLQQCTFVLANNQKSMKALDKATLLESLEQQVEQHMEEAISTYQNMSDTLLLKPATDGGWSIAQCLDHLNGYGHYYLPQIRQGMEKQTEKPVSNTFKSSWLGNYFTRAMDPATGKKKIKAFKNHIPDRTLDAHAVVAEFIQQQEELLHYLRQARSKDLNSIKIPISISRWIRLKLGDVFQFLIAHNERHMQQAKRVLIHLKDLQVVHKQ